MSTQIRVEWDIAGVKLALADVSDGQPEHTASAIVWGPPTRATIQPGEDIPSDCWLHIREHEARAIYEGLADYFGHSGHDTRALRKDYDAERARVDKLIEATIAARNIIQGLQR